MTVEEKINKVLEITELEINDFALKCEISPDTLKKAIKRNSLSPDIVQTIHDKFGIRKEFLKDGKGTVLKENSTPASKLTGSKEIQRSAKETFFEDLIERNDSYFIAPRAIFTDYKIVPDKIIDVIIRSTDEARQALEKAKDLEIESLNIKNETIIQGLEIEIAKLKQENTELRRQIPGQG